MCDPVTIAAVGVGALHAQSSFQDAKAQYAVGKYNARQQENQAIRTRNVGVEKENAYRQEVAAKVSRQKAQYAASGVDVNTGVAQTVQEQTAQVGEADALRIRSNYTDQSQMLEEQSKLTLATARSAFRSNRMKAILSGVQAGAATYGTFSGAPAPGGAA